MERIEISIVVVSCNRAELLRNAISSLLEQEIEEQWPFELVVVDDGSTDNTAEMLAAIQANSRGIPVNVMRTTGVGVSAARNLGVRAARGQWIASFDDDQVAVKDWLLQLRRAAALSGAPCIGGALALRLPEGSPTDLGLRTRKILGEHLVSDQLQRYPRRVLPATNNALVLRDLFLRLNGFDANFLQGGEDTDFFLRVRDTGAEIWFSPEALAFHIIPEQRVTAGYFRWTAWRVGATSARMYGKKSTFLLLSFVVFRSGVLLLRDLPLYLMWLLRRDQSQIWETQCSMWFTQGYLRVLPSVLLPRFFQASGFLKTLDFRSHHGERKG
ncbi:MAG: glycosyltransferase family 2 protein [Acidobacteriaceae bacterium]